MITEMLQPCCYFRYEKTHLSYILLLLQLSGWNVMQILQDCEGVIIHDE